MKLYHKRLWSVSLALLALLALLFSAGCGQVKPRPSPQAGQPDRNQIPAPVRVGMVVPRPGQVDDYVIKEATRAFSFTRERFWTDPRLLQPGELLNDKESMRYLAENDYKLIIVFSSMTRALQEIAPEYPDVKFAVIDGLVQGDNIISVEFREQEGAFLAGALSALISSTGQVGIVATHDPGTQPYVSGYKAGVDYISKADKRTVGFRIMYTPGDRSAVEEVAYAGYYAGSLFDTGTDIILSVPARISPEIYKAAYERRKFAIGVNENLNKIYPGNLYATLEKRVDQAVYGLVSDAITNKLGSGVRTLGIAQNAVGINDLRKGPVFIAPEIVARIEAVKRDIISGKIKVE